MPNHLQRKPTLCLNIWTEAIAAIGPNLYEFRLETNPTTLDSMRKALKFFHTLASCGLVGALLGYTIILSAAPQDTATTYADMRQSISALCSYLLVPSLGVALVTGVFSMVAHPPFLKMRWVWVKAGLGLAMFEGTLAIVGARADHAARISARIAEGKANVDALQTVLAYEWQSLGLIMALSLANIVLGVWRPKLKSQRSYQLTE